MKSFATLCLLGIALAVRLEKPEREDKKDGDCGRPEKCLGEIPDGVLDLIKRDVKEGLMEKEVPEDKAEQAAGDLVEGQKKGASCSDLERGIKERVKELGGDSDAQEEAVERIEAVARGHLEQNELAERKRRSKKDELAEKRKSQ